MLRKHACYIHTRTNILPQNQWGVGCFLATVVGSSVLRHPFQVTILQMCLPQIEAFTHSERTVHFRTEGLQYGIFMDFHGFSVLSHTCILHRATFGLREV